MDYNKHRGEKPQCLNVCYGSRLCENKLRAISTQDWFVSSPLGAAIFCADRPFDSIVARERFLQAFLHSLGQKQKSAATLGMSAAG